jgi:hypothetical protein
MGRRKKREWSMISEGRAWAWKKTEGEMIGNEKIGDSTVKSRNFIGVIQGLEGGV